MPRKATINPQGQAGWQAESQPRSNGSRMENTSKEQMSHMEGGKPRKAPPSGNHEAW
jgi:hypothetical protein